MRRFYTEEEILRAIDEHGKLTARALLRELRPGALVLAFYLPALRRRLQTLLREKLIYARQGLRPEPSFYLTAAGIARLRALAQAQPGEAEPFAAEPSGLEAA
ncbi:MAG TPA: hypothetical protein VHC68_01670 [Candidatus Paceibacterota bacterium]|nr:hypothetical protein [Candidatus Paceibacterota bacterium]